MWGFSELERMGKDLRYAVRQLIRRPVWTIVVVLTLALGISANTSIFTLVDAMLLRPAPWSHDDRLVWVTSLNPRSGRVGNVSYADYLAYLEEEPWPRAPTSPAGRTCRAHRFATSRRRTSWRCLRYPSTARLPCSRWAISKAIS